VVAAACAGVAVWSGLQVLVPGPGATVPVLIAKRDLAWGSAIGRGDVVTVRLPAAAAPSRVLREPAQAIGRWPASPVRRGEPITDLRLLGGAATDPRGGDGVVAAPIRIADPAAARLLHAGMTIDVLSVPGDEFTAVPSGSPAEVVAPGVRVLSVSASDDAAGGQGALVVVATSAGTAARLAMAGASGRLSITWHPAPGA